MVKKNISLAFTLLVLVTAGECLAGVSAQFEQAVNPVRGPLAWWRFECVGPDGKFFWRGSCNKTGISQIQRRDDEREQRNGNEPRKIVSFTESTIFSSHLQLKFHTKRTNIP